MANILLTGGSGMVGSHLCTKLRNRGYEVAVLSRSPNTDSKQKYFLWDIAQKQIDEEAIKWADSIIHLAGANIGEKRWNKQRKQLIIDSRVKSAELLLDTVVALNKKIDTFITASAIGYYGAITSSEIMTETSSCANDFLGQTCQQWESVADKFANVGIRTVKIRTGIVLWLTGGAMAKIIRPVKKGMGLAIGSGKQYFPWIHIDDLCSVYTQALENKKMQGPYNAVVPEHITNEEFMKKLAQKFKKPFFRFKIPASALKLFFGEMSSLFLYGSRISAEKLQKTGFSFMFPTIDSYLKEMKI